MLKFVPTALLGVVAGSAMLVAGGCQSSGGEPYGLTGQEVMSYSQQMKYTDQKGHYRPEFASRGEQIQPGPAD